MKNIHLLPTDKPSRVFITNEDKHGFREHYVPDTMQTVKCINIYITNDEEIKEGNYGILGKEVLSYHQMHKRWGMPQGKKIILTTDQDLIKNGVQAIDDEFLEWFVKNPSCEEVEFVKDLFQVNQNNPILKGSTALAEGYKIIIPKEEPKQLTDLEPTMITDWLDKHGNPEITKRVEEEAEFREAAEKYINDDLDLYESLVDGHISYNIGIDLLNKLFTAGAKWQKERM